MPLLAKYNVISSPTALQRPPVTSRDLKEPPGTHTKKVGGKNMILDVLKAHVVQLVLPVPGGSERFLDVTGGL